MTFDAIKKAVKDYVNLSSQEADTRIGEAINRHYQRVTASLGLDIVRFVTRSASMTAGVRTVTFTQIEKIDRIIDTTDSTAIRTLREASVNTIRTTQPTSGQPTEWAPLSSTSNSVTAVFDTLPQTAYSLQADGWATVTVLQGNDEPQFAESYHDILTWSVLAEELLRKDKLNLAEAYEVKAEKLLSEFRHFLAESHSRFDVARSSLSSSLVSGGSGGGSSSLGGTAYTQTALLTFDLGSGIAPFAIAQSNAPVVTNLDADKLDGEHGSFYLDRANHTGSAALAVTDITPVTTDRLVGRDTAGTGAAEQLTVGGGIEFTGSGGIQRSALTGDVTASAGSNATTIATSAVTTAKIADDNVTDAKLRESAAVSIIGRSANSTGNPADIAASSNNQVLARISDALTFSGGLVFDGSNKITQISFAAAQSASSDSNTLDDYEESTWTPVDSSGAALSFTTEGSYIKIGQLVVAAATVTYPATGDASNAIIGALPFTIQDTTNDVFVAVAINTTGTMLCVKGLNNTTTVQILNASSEATITNANMSGQRIRFTFVYRATA